MGCHFLLQGIFPTQGLNLHLLVWQVDSLPLSHQGSPLRKWKQSIENFLMSPLRNLYTALHLCITYCFAFSKAYPIYANDTAYALVPASAPMPKNLIISLSLDSSDLNNSHPHIQMCSDIYHLIIILSSSFTTSISNCKANLIQNI